MHILDASESGIKQNQPVTPTNSKKGKCKRITEVRSETQLTVSSLGKAAIKGMYINIPVIQHLLLQSLYLCVRSYKYEVQKLTRMVFNFSAVCRCFPSRPVLKLLCASRR